MCLRIVENYVRPALKGILSGKMEVFETLTEFDDKLPIQTKHFLLDLIFCLFLLLETVNLKPMHYFLKFVRYLNFNFLTNGKLLSFF